MKNLSKILSLIIAVAMLFPQITPVLAAEDVTVYVNETFESTPVNGKPSKLKIEKGTDARVLVDDEKSFDKAVYGKAITSKVTMNIPVNGTENKFVVSVDVKVDGARTNADLISLKDGSNIPLIKYKKEGSIHLSNGLRVGGYKLGKWMNYTFLMNASKGKYDLYIDGKKIIADWYLQAPIKNLTQLVFDLSKPADAEFAELYIDNIRVYSGNKILPDDYFPKQEKNENVYPFEPAPPLEMGNEVFFRTSGNKGFTPQFAAKTGTADFAPVGDEEQLRLHFARSAGTYTDVFADIVFNGTENVLHYVWQYDVYPKTINSDAATYPSNFTDAAGKGFGTTLLGSNGDLKYNGTTLVNIPLGEWSTVALVYKLDMQTVDVYLNGSLMTEGFPVVASDPAKLRIGLHVGSAEAEVYYDNMLLYEGSAPRTLEESDGEMVIEYVANAENQADVEKIIGDGGVVLSTTKDALFFNKEKTKYSALNLSTISENGIFYAEADVFKTVLGAEVAYSAESGDITLGGARAKVGSTELTADGKAITLKSAPISKDGKVYLPVADFAQHALSKSVYDDPRGWMVISASNRGLSNSATSTDCREDSDIVDRFMQFERPSGDEMYNAIKAKSFQKHPRLITTPEELAVIKENIKTHPVVAKWSRMIVSSANSIIGKTPVVYEKPDGLRLFLSCLEVRERLYTYSAAYLMTGDKKYAEGAWTEIENALNWPDWNVNNHYLDSGKIGPGMAVAYDSFYDVFTDEQKKFMREKVTKHLLEYTLGAYTGNNAHKNMISTESNWGAVINGSVLMWCLATMDEEAEDSEYTELVKFLGSCANQGMEYTLSCLYPSGAWNEGLTYFGYVSEYQGWTMLSLINSCGSDYGHLTYPGYTAMADYAMYIQTPGHGYFNFSDGAGIGEAKATPPEIFVISKLTNNQKLNDNYYNFRFNMLGMSADVMDIFYYMPGDTASTDNDFPLDYMSGGLKLASMRQSWGDMSSTWLGALGGTGSGWDHFHSGTFLWEALGERWAVDLGHDDYNIEGGYFGVDGYSLYRRRAEGHNVVVINPDEGPGQKPYNTPLTERYETKPRGGIVVYDLSDTYSENASKARRGFYYGDDRNTLTVQDEITMLKSGSEVYWFMHTKSNIQISADGKSAILTQNGKQLKVEFLTNLTNWKLEAMDAVPLPTSPAREGQGKNTGVTKLALHGKSGKDCYITAKLTPIEKGGNYAPISYTSIDSWTIPDGEVTPKMLLTSISVDGNTIPGIDGTKEEYLYATTDTSHIPVVTATATRGTVTVTQAPAFDDYAIITLSDGVDALTYKVKIEEGLLDSLAQSDEKLKTAEGGKITFNLTKNLCEASVPAGMKRLPIKGFYCSDAQAGNPAENIFDKNFISRWASDVEGAYITMDLGEVTDINGVTMAFYLGNSRNYKFELLVSEDNKDFTMVYQGYSQGGTDSLETVKFDAKARYVKFVGYAHKTDIWNGLTEMSPFVIE